MGTLAPRALSAARRASALYCGVHGGGTPLLLIHDLGASGAMFQPLLPRLARRTRCHRHPRRTLGFLPVVALHNLDFWSAAGFNPLAQRGSSTFGIVGVLEFAEFSV